jgi:anti-sigma B factor antagonist
MEFAVDQIGDVSLITIQVNKLDAANAKDFKADVTPLLANRQRLVLDLGNLTFVDSSGLGAILSCLKQVTGTQGELKLCNLTKAARILFELVRMHKVFEIFNTREEAVASFKK